MAYYTSKGSIRLPSTPRSVELITKAAQDYDYSSLVPLHYWLRTARTLLKEVLSL
jgi:hypothetical protein